jgi:hypothetical protein
MAKPVFDIKAWAGKKGEEAFGPKAGKKPLFGKAPEEDEEELEEEDEEEEDEEEEDEEEEFDPKKLAAAKKVKPAPKGGKE